MSVLWWAQGELLSYGVLWWLLLAAIVFLAARFGGLLGLFCGHLAVTMCVTVLDLLWIQSEIHDPGWDGQPDQDGIFLIGVLIRIVLVNAVLVPISSIGCLIGLLRKVAP